MPFEKNATATEHLSLKTLLTMILKIFLTLMECDEEQKMSGARMAWANFLACDF
jgi:uncharacterized lipoprotein NlpE involved in copper resistance